ncbi:uncharacterized protein LOC141903366 isoform X3 [Tubulanus polymorphus]|uniref:uncharacterized protein LOC141903366 isoform X3 n=1 Tax=Tubulanus polymorphus TaxID=672921 RepID=UPI003DA37358
MSSTDVIKTVSKKLKYYFEVKRLEDGFDLSASNSPKLDHPPLKPRPTLQYDGLHDRPVKHYFSDANVKARLTHMNATPPPRSPLQRVRSATPSRARPKSGQPRDKPHREKQIKKTVKKHMNDTKWVDQRPFIPPRGTLKNPWLPEYAYIQTSKGSKLRPEMTGFGVPLKKSKKQYKGGQSVLRTAPSTRISKGEAVRLVNMATKLLLATENVDFSKLNMKYSPSKKKAQNTALPQVPSQRPKTSRGRARPSTAKYTYDIHGHKMKVPYKSYDDSYIVDERNSDRNENPSEVSSYDSRNLPRWLRKEINNMDSEVPNEQRLYVRTQSATEPKSVAKPRKLKGTRPKSAKYRKRPSRSEIPKGAIVSPDAQVDDDDDDDSSEDAVYANTEDAWVQTDKQLMDQYDYMDEEITSGKMAKYCIYVRTGKRLGASTKADVYITLYGTKGKTTEILLASSKTHKVKFLKGQEDEFLIDAFHVGELRKIRVGHNRIELGFGWFLDSITVDDLEDKVSYRFPCGRWLSYQDEDGQTKRMLTVSTTRTVTTAESEATSEASDTETNASSKKSQKSSRKSSASHRTSTKSLASSEVNDEESERSSVVANKSRPDSASSESTSKSGSTYTETGSSSEYSSDGETERSVETEPVRKKEREVRASGLMASPPAQKQRSSNESAPARRENDDFFDQDAAASSRPNYSRIPKRDEADDESVQPQFSSSRPSSSRSDASSSAPVVHPDRENPAFVETKNVSEPRNDARSRPKTADRRSKITKTIHQAASAGDLKTVKKIIQLNEATVNSKDDHGLTALHYATTDGHLELVRWLCENGADLKSETPTGYSAVHLAALSGHVHCLMVLVEHGASINVTSIDDCTPLHLAARSGNLHTCKWLVSNGAALTDVDMMGRTALDFANNYDQEEVEDFLEQAGKTQQNQQHAELAENGKSTARSTSTSTSGPNSSQIAHHSSEKSSSSEKSDRGTERRPSLSDKKKQQMEEDLKDKREQYELQKQEMKRRKSSFLDSIRDEALD